MFCGFDDWRVPTIAELLTIVNKGTFDPNTNASSPAIDTNYFPNTLTRRYWSSSPSAENDGRAWNISFFFGQVGDSFRTDGGTVRLVRSGQ